MDLLSSGMRFFLEQVDTGTLLITQNKSKRIRFIVTLTSLNAQIKKMPLGKLLSGCKTYVARFACTLSGAFSLKVPFCMKHNGYKQNIVIHHKIRLWCVACLSAILLHFSDIPKLPLQPCKQPKPSTSTSGMPSHCRSTAELGTELLGEKHTSAFYVSLISSNLASNGASISMQSRARRTQKPIVLPLPMSFWGLDWVSISSPKPRKNFFPFLPARPLNKRNAVTRVATASRNARQSASH